MQNTLPIGTIIRNQYLVQQLLGKATFSAVYLVSAIRLVEEPRGKRYVSTNFALQEVIIPNRQLRHQISFEALPLRRIDHEALPHIYEVFNINIHNRLYMLMDYIEGPNLEKLRSQQPDERLLLSQAMAIMAPVIDSVSYLHSQQPPIIHQNIEPTSIILSKTTNKPVLVDFGVGKNYNISSLDVPVRRSVIGYEAPEQYSGEEIDTRTDIYGLGATFYTLLTGSIPTDALQRKRLTESEHVDPLKPVDQVVPAIPPHTAVAIQRAMSLSSHDRFLAVEQFVQALEAEPTQQPPEPITVLPATQDHKVSPPDVEPSIIEQFVQALEAEPTQQLPEPGIVLPAAQDHEISPPDVEPSIQEDQNTTVPVNLPPAPLPSPVPPSRRVETQPPMPVTEPPRAPTARKPAALLLILLALIVSVGVSTGLLLYIRGHRSPDRTTPTTAVLHKTALPSTSVPTEAPASSSIITLAESYNGTIYDLSLNMRTTMFLTQVQQSQGNISGYFNGLQINGPFKGSFNTSRHIQFTIMGLTSHAMLAFEGAVLSDGNLAGSFCNLNPAGQCASKYGVWSAAPVSL
jgi:serine/threonine protein kinase